MNFLDYKQKSLPNLKEQFWSGQFICNDECPECMQNSDLLVTMTKASVRVYCQNESCKKLFFYRRINLAQAEGYKPE